MGPRAVLRLELAVVVLLVVPVDWWLAIEGWQLLYTVPSLLVPVGTSAFSLAVLPALLGTVLAGVWVRLRPLMARRLWLGVWAFAGPWLLAGVVPLVAPFGTWAIPGLLLFWLLLGALAQVDWWPAEPDERLHKARLANRRDIGELIHPGLPSDGLLIGLEPSSRWVAVQAQPERKELGNLLVVGPTRSGKGLLATSQLLSWGASVLVNDIKGELYAATAGYRATLGPVFVLDHQAVGHRYDPLASRHSEDAFYAAATQLLFHPDEGDGAIFTQRAVVMLTQLFCAAEKEGLAPLPYVRHLVRSGLQPAATRLQQVDPLLATQLLDGPFEHTDFTNRFLLSAWGTLSARLRPLLGEQLVRCFAGSDFTAEDLLLSEKPVSVYLRWSERDLLALTPLVRLLWDSLIGELISAYDLRGGVGCKPVLALIDEAGRTPIPSLAEHATTVVGRGLNLWIAIQSLSQLEASYGKARAQVLRDNADSQVFYRPTDLATATYLEKRLGEMSAYARSSTLREGEETSEGRSERPIPLLTAQEILQLGDEETISFHRRLPPMRLSRVDWRNHDDLKQRRGIPAPAVSPLPAVVDHVDHSLHQAAMSVASPTGYIDPDARR